MWPNGLESNGERLLGWALVLTGALAARLAITEPGTPWFIPVGIIALLAGLACVLAIGDAGGNWLTRSDRGNGLHRAGTLLGVVLLVGPLLEGLGRTFFGFDVRPLEQVAVIALINFAFFAAAAGRLRRNNAIAVGVASALLVGALMIGEHQAITPLAAAFGGLGVGWLALHHWQVVSAAGEERRARRLPLVPVFALMLVLGGLTTASTRFANGGAEIWGEWLASSGGSSRDNRDAMLGVGDGDRVTSGPNARSTGPVDSDYFLESDLPTLWDVFTDTYGEPSRPKDTQRAITASPDQLIKNNGHTVPEVGKAGREFTLYRRTRAVRPPRSEEAKALLYVEGRAPIHLALAAYDVFDGVSWHEPTSDPIACRVASESNDSWLWLPWHPNGMCGSTHTYVLRFGLLSSERIPLPNHLERFRLDGRGDNEVHRWAQDVLMWAHEGIMASRRCLPPGTVLEVAAPRVDRSLLTQPGAAFRARPADEACLRVPEHLAASADTLVERFAHLPRGWTQVDAVLEHLRTHYKHDREARVPEDCADPIHHFLQQAGGGPAYQFATTAALTLRRMKYLTRVVSGFYVDPADYVARAGHTAIHTEDAHIWIEVRTASGAWITLDPTPGYETEWHEPTFGECVRIWAATLVGPVAANPVGTGFGLLLSAMLWLGRLRVRERFLTAWCQWSPIGATARLRITLALLDLRCRLAGVSRPPSRTPQAWYQRLDSPVVHRFMQRLYATMYAPDPTHERADRAEIKRLCQAVVRAARMDNLRTDPDPT